MKIKFSILSAFIWLLFNNPAYSKECTLPIDTKSLRVISQGTFLLSLDSGNAYVSSYLPSGTVVKVNGYRTINYHKRKGKPPIPQCYISIKTNLGKHGYVLEDTAKNSSTFPGEYLFPRTNIEIYKKPDFDKVKAYKAGSLKKKEIFMSSTYPKNKEKLQVVGMDDDQDFYIVKGAFLGVGVKGYVLADDIDSGKAAVIDAANASFVSRKMTNAGENIKQTLKSLLGNEVYSELKESLNEYTQNIELEICKIPINVTPYTEAKVGSWWITGGIKIEGKINIKAANRSYAHESHYIKLLSGNKRLELVKHLTCDADSMLYPIMLKIKQGNYFISLRRDNFSSLGSVFRKKADAIADDQYKTILTIRNYGDWLVVYRHLDSTLSNWRGEYGENYDVFLDVLIDSIAYYPPSKKRTLLGAVLDN